MIKRTVVLDPFVDSYLRKVWALLIDSGGDANYSTALNFVLLAAILEARKAPGSMPRDTRRLIWDFATNPQSTESLRVDETREVLVKFWGRHGLEARPGSGERSG